MKKTKLKPFEIFYDKQAQIYVAKDPDTRIASQGYSVPKAYNNLIEALRLCILTYQDIGERKKKGEKEGNR
jgi:predicted RNase H-like HicB family nuclease